MLELVRGVALVNTPTRASPVGVTNDGIRVGARGKGALRRTIREASRRRPRPFTLLRELETARSRRSPKGATYLVTVRSNEPWLVAVPERRATCVRPGRAVNEVPVTNVKALLESCASTGKGSAPSLGSSRCRFQTPRVLTQEDVAKLEALIAGKRRRGLPPRHRPHHRPAGARMKGAPLGGRSLAAPPRPASVLAEAVFDDLDRRWIDLRPDGREQGVARMARGRSLGT